ncbi:MAG: hypothetical protein KatS3mg115_1194 [Candidatus Poribacteria bacterium]|nr:MAG: hypothetical protein KatS3mg115_1194 [Candidatus Poribacteria bacterium]
MPGITVGHIAEPSFCEVQETFSRWNPAARLGRGAFTGEGFLHSESVRYVWVESGEGSLFLPAGTRTQEGDGEPLGEEYRPDPLNRETREALELLKAHQGDFDPAIRQPVRAILERWHGEAFVGDIAGELWLIVESGLEPTQYAADPTAREALEHFFCHFRTLGWSEKTQDGWESFQAGDQLTLVPGRPLRLRGEFRYWYVDVLDQHETHVSPARRLRHLKDTAGGCNFAFDAFRRLPMTWILGTGTPENPGRNQSGEQPCRKHCR